MKITKVGPAIFPELRGNLASLRFPCFGEIKYDGEATLIGYHKDSQPAIFTSNKYGTSRIEWSKLDEIADILDNNDVEEAVFLGELYYGTGKSGALYELLKHKDSDDLNISIFDSGHVKFLDGRKMQGELTPLVTRKEILIELFNDKFIVKPQVIYSKSDAETYFCQHTQDGYEGIVLKNFDGFLTRGPCTWVKMKHKDRSNYLVIGVSPTQERIDIQVPNPNMPTQGKEWAANIKVGVKVTNKYKKDLQPGDYVEIEHQGVLDSGSLRHPVFIQKVKVEGGKE